LTQGLSDLLTFFEKKLYSQ